MILIEGGNRRIGVRVVLILFGVGHLHVEIHLAFPHTVCILLESSTVYVVVVLISLV